jgi:uncharacterized Rmd1/YagE family protein
MTNRTSYALNAYSAPVHINLRETLDLLPGEPKERYDQDCLIVHRSEIAKIFIFRFGTVVFFDIPPEEHPHYLTALGITPKTKTDKIPSDDVAEENFSLTIGPGPMEVSFNSVKFSEFDLSKVQIVAHVLAQSSALEIIEWDAEDFLTESDKMSRYLMGGRFASRSRHRLLQFIGEGLSARHRIVNQVLLLNEPEKTWEKENLSHLYHDLFKTFDMKDRLERLDKMLNLSADVSGLLLEIVHTQRAEIMELIIIALISMELLQSIFLH